MGRIILVFYFLLIIGINYVLAQEEEEVSKRSVSVGISKEEKLERYIDEIKEIYSKLGIKKGYVQVDKNGKISLEGTFKDYDEFLSAYMVAQAVAGVNNVNPAYNVVVAKILKRPSEECLALAMAGFPKQCKNYIDIQTNATLDLEELERQRREQGLPPALIEAAKIFEKIKEKGDGMQKDKGKKGEKDITLQETISVKEAIIIAVGKYKHDIIPSLGDAVINDAYLVKDMLEKRGFKVTMLINENATYENTKKAIRQVIERLKDGDTLFLYASTHGAPKSPNGDTGIVLYDTWVEKKPGGMTACQTLEEGLKRFEEPKKESKSDFLKSFIGSSKKVDESKARDIVITASKMCTFLKNSLVLTDDVLPLIEASGKKIRLIVNPDVCYSGGALKSILGSVKDEVYTYNEYVAGNLVNLISAPFIFISATSQNQLSLQKEFNGKQHGIFSYYFYNSLPSNNYNLHQTFESSKDIIKKESGMACRKLKEKRGSENCAVEGQIPLYINNGKASNEL